jgi:peptide deformylase
MILPIHVYGHPSLREPTEEVTENTPEIQALIDDMIETMHGASGIGLAAPQVGRRERIFVADLRPMREAAEEEGLTVPSEPMVFINPQIVGESDIETEFEEGCLSLPEIRDNVWRPESVRLTYLDRNFEPHEEELTGLLARVVQHEYDHVEGILFIDHLSALKRRLLKRRLKEVSDLEVETDYPVTR